MRGHGPRAKAARAARTARSTTAGLASSTSLTCSSVAGLITGSAGAELAGKKSLSMKAVTRLRTAYSWGFPAGGARFMGPLTDELAMLRDNQVSIGYVLCI